MTDDRLRAAGLASALPEIEYRPSPVRLFQFSAATGNAHRIHYDEAYRVPRATTVSWCSRRCAVSSC